MEPCVNSSTILVQLPITQHVGSFSHRRSYLANPPAEFIKPEGSLTDKKRATILLNIEVTVLEHSQQESDQIVLSVVTASQTGGT